VQVIPAGVGNTDVDALDLGFSLFPVVRKLFLAAHSLLRFAEIGGVAPEGVQWGADRSIGESGKADHAHIDAYGIALGDALFYFTHCLDGDEPFQPGPGDADSQSRGATIFDAADTAYSRCTWHLVFVTKYRREVFTKEVLGDLQGIFSGVGNDFEAELVEFEAELVEFDGEQDHVHLLVNYHPKVGGFRPRQ